MALAAWSAPWQSRSSTAASLTPPIQASCQTPSSGCGRRTCTAASMAATLVGMLARAAQRVGSNSVEQRRLCLGRPGCPSHHRFRRSPASVAVGCRTHAHTCGHAPDCVSLCLPLPPFNPTQPSTFLQRCMTQRAGLCPKSLRRSSASMTGRTRAASAGEWVGFCLRCPLPEFRGGRTRVASAGECSRSCLGLVNLEVGKTWPA